MTLISGLVGYLTVSTFRIVGFPSQGVTHIFYELDVQHSFSYQQPFQNEELGGWNSLALVSNPSNRRKTLT